MADPTEADKAAAIEWLGFNMSWRTYSVTDVGSLAKFAAGMREAGRQERDGHKGCDAMVLEARAGEKRMLGNLEAAEDECAKLKQAIEALMNAPPALMSHAGRLVPINADGMREVVDECAKLRAEKESDRYRGIAWMDRAIIAENKLLDVEAELSKLREKYAAIEADFKPYMLELGEQLRKNSELREDRDRLIKEVEHAKLHKRILVDVLHGILTFIDEIEMEHHFADQIRIIREGLAGLESK